MPALTAPLGNASAGVAGLVSPARPVRRFRLSVAFFSGANLKAAVPLLKLAPEYAAKALWLTQDPLFRYAGENCLKSRLRTHPDAARARYADLLTPEDLSKELLASSGY